MFPDQKVFTPPRPTEEHGFWLPNSSLSWIDPSASTHKVHPEHHHPSVIPRDLRHAIVQKTREFVDVDDCLGRNRQRTCPTVLLLYSECFAGETKSLAARQSGRGLQRSHCVLPYSAVPPEYFVRRDLWPPRSP